MKKVKEEVLMNGKAIMREAMAERGVTQKELGARIGMLQTSISASLVRERVSLEMFSRLMNGMGYAVAVVDKQSGDVRWVVDENK